MLTREMRMMESDRQSPERTVAADYRVMNEHMANIAAGNVIPGNVGMDEDDDDGELVIDGDLSLGGRRSTSGDASASPHNRTDYEKRLRREIANSNERRRMQSINDGFQSLKALLPRHDGEKISKASILQRTAEYLRRLQAEKDQLIRQRSGIKRQCDIGGMEVTIENSARLSCVPKDPRQFGNSCNQERTYAVLDKPIAPLKKRKKFDNDSADEGVGMMSDVEAMAAVRPSPSISTTWTQTDPPRRTADSSSCTSPLPMTADASLVQEKVLEIELLQRQLIELRVALDRERRARLMLEEQIQTMELNHIQALIRLQPALSGTPAMAFSPMLAGGAEQNERIAPATTAATKLIMTTVPPLPSFLPTIDHEMDPLRSVPTPIASLMQMESMTVTCDTERNTMQSQPNNGNERNDETCVDSDNPNKNTGSRQSLAAIVEAIRHLEGDQLFVDVDSHRPSVKNKMETPPTAAAGMNCPIVTYFTPSRPDYTDSGISSPVSDRQTASGITSSTFGHANGSLRTTSTGSDDVLAETAAALHNLWIPCPRMDQVGNVGLGGLSASRLQLQ